MTETQKKEDPRVLVTEPVRLAYPSLFVRRPKFPSKDPNRPPKMTYQCTLLLPPETKLGRYKKALEVAVLEKWGKRVTLNPEKYPIKDAARKEGSSGFDEGWHYIALHSERPVGVVDQSCVPIVPDEDEDPANPGRFRRSSKIYPGVWALAYINAFGWDYEGVKGVSFGLQGIQLVKDDERLDNQVKLGDVFKPLDGAGDSEDSGDWEDVAL